MAKERIIITETMDWQGITLSVSYEANWLNMERSSKHAVAHLQVEAISPMRARLPITETGYRSHFQHPGAIAMVGGALAYVRIWLDEEAQSRPGGQPPTIAVLGGRAFQRGERNARLAATSGG